MIYEYAQLGSCHVAPTATGPGPPAVRHQRRGPAEAEAEGCWPSASQPRDKPLNLARRGEIATKTQNLTSRFEI
jgi:hypothetical protein